jgi:hypothetical protein
VNLPDPPRPTESDATIRAALIDAAQGDVGSGVIWIDTDAYTTPIYIVSNTQPKVPVVLDSFRSGTTMQDALDLGVPIPPGAQPSAGTDAHLTVWQIFANKLWSCFGTHKTGGTWYAATCQMTNSVSTDPGYATQDSWLPFSDSGPVSQDGHNWTSTATGLAVVQGTMTVAQLEAHQIGHALALDLPNVCGGHSDSYYSWPAQQHDGGSATGSCVPEGAKVYLPQGENCGPLIQAAETICNALRNKGAIVRDSAPGVGLYAEDTKAEGTDQGCGAPYYCGENLFGGQYPSTFLSYANFPWGDIKVLPIHKCTNQGVPCLP